MIGRYVPAYIELPETATTSEMREMLGEFRRTADEMRDTAERIEAALKNERLSYSEQEAAAVLEMKPITLERLRRAGKISYTRVAGRARYTRAHLESYLENAATLCALDRKKK